MNNMQVTEPIVTRAPEADWSGWENWLRSHLDIEREVVIEACGEALIRSRNSVSGLQARIVWNLAGGGGCRPRRISIAPVAIVAFAGGTWQATRDTARVPGAQDWVCLARSGNSLTPRGAYDDHADYRCLDVTMVNGSSFVALKDAPGLCPGPGWQLLASQGKRGLAGEKGERGPAGPRGEPGAAAPTIRAWEVDRARYLATPVMSDGSDGPPLELRALFEQFFSEVR
jgi:hypothetical protein